MAAADVEMPVAESSSLATLSRRQHLGQTFEAYRAELDDENALREKLIILSRSITQLSKKLIFHLHRGATSQPAQRQKNIREAEKKEREIAEVFKTIRQELSDARAGESWTSGFWKWRKSITPGLEEYIEALSFMWYLQHGGLVPLDNVQKALSDENGESLIFVTPEDYILGMSDLTGELMRYATNALGTGDHETPLSICDFVRTVKTHFDAVNPDAIRQLSKKQEETQRSLEKIEKVCYALRLRLIEFADRPDILAQMAKRALDDADDKGQGLATE
ncbi:hypothetical protein C343_04372 [Cryptococcus neoformans C23]|uniref:Translin n=1 Tax=Cryptococcus neoformans (strain H99 / ATCC 208821 / CBS 10515 / FGSC 9487) TaxID=235443 RepID=J9VPR1_CRYN9|nr:hypothetical protein CNAG_05934 [Cryptococcus neoformans var. grubii H99]AUB26149.1 hypothetical protein CKF44_05934 [Cryptococcus neoformans var. grubii]OWZ30669.1 hypothetical protein C347_04431 [Cryptococcus neoformans var. grubii AD2-60a]OWZ42443.1 hypothetical protein C343_04372 [Cryptococcus neoformans var. grubii C23]OXC83614.1 hypothetical protein C344_04116 [Cryptococcus neoformans var. grubii AD1-7a]AFR96253.2 hypothetical protein CNAG_05934 [Cryptococcus neoformans var. grubii H9|eukprot:XP_012050425.1 hypothetical protein CNAG_05934 [Cryptococcus neoformans var. grubii H99]